jgi:hypothetical protein
MNRLVGTLAITIVILGVVSGFLFYQNNELQKVNRELRNHNSEIQNQLDEQETDNIELQNQILELENQTLELQNQVNQLTQLSTIKNSSIVVKVTNFTTSGMSTIVGVLMESDATITIQNLGTNDLKGLTLAMVHIGDDPAASLMNHQSFKIESLEAGEEQTVSTNVYWALGAGVRVMISIKLDDIILDEYSTY